MYAFNSKTPDSKRHSEMTRNVSSRQGLRAIQFKSQSDIDIAKNKMHEMANKSMQVKQLRAAQNLANQHSQKQPLQRMVIQRQAIDDDVLDGTLEQIIERINAIAYGKDTREPIQERITDLWAKQGALMNEIRSRLSGAQEGDENAVALNTQFSKFTTTLAFAGLLLEGKKITLPKIPLYEAQHGVHLPGGGGDDN